MKQNIIFVFLVAALGGMNSRGAEGAFEQVNRRPIVAQLLRWAGPDDQKETDSELLAKAIGEGNPFGVSGDLETFPDRYPENGWAPSVRLIFAKGYRERGRSTRALEVLRQGWSEARELKSEAGRQIGDEFLGELSQLLASLGRVEELGQLFAQGNGRQFVAATAARRWRNAQDGYSTMKDYPGVAFRCGTFALTEVFRVLQAPGSFLDEASPTNGFTLEFLAKLAEDKGQSMHAVRRLSGAEIPVPSVIHWKQNHYAAVVAKEGPQLKVIDPTFGTRKWLAISDVNEEASGYFLVPATFHDPAFVAMTAEEAGKVRGQGQPNNIKDWEDEGCNKVPGGVGAPENGVLGNGSSTAECIPCKGLAQWWVSEPYINLFVADQPLSYQTSKGEPLTFRLTYKQRDVDDAPSFGFDGHLPYRNQGMANAAWSHNWISYIRYIENDYPSSAITYTHFEGMLYFSGAGSFNFHEDSVGNRQGNRRLVIQKLADGVALSTNTMEFCNAESATNVGFSVTYPDGSQDVYGLVILLRNRFAGVSGEQLAAFLTMRIDAAGRKTKLCYEHDSTIPVRVKSVTDFDGKTSTFQYHSTFNDKVVQVTDPYQRHCDLDYDGNGRLWKIHDAAGLTTEIQYRQDTNSSGAIAGLVTPYGTTGFSFYEDSSWQNGTNQGNFGGHDRVNRAISVAEPNGGRHLFLYRYDLVELVNTFPSSFSSGEVPTVSGFGGSYFDNGDSGNNATNAAIYFRNSFYWGPRQHGLLSHTNVSSLNSLTATEYAFGRWRHWLDSVAPQTVSDRLSLERGPSPANDGSLSGTKTWYGYAHKAASHRIGYASEGFIGQPAVIAQVLADGTAQFTSYVYNDDGRVVTQSSSYTATNGTTSTRSRTFGYSGRDLTSIGGFQGETKLTLQYNQYHQVTSVTDAVGATGFVYESSTNYNLTEIHWPNGLVMAQEAFFPTHQLWLTNTTAALATNSFTYTNGQVRTMTDARGLTRTFSWDALDRLTEIAYPNSQTVSLVYGKLGGQAFSGSTGETNLLDVTAIKDRNGQWTYFEYNPARQVTGITNGNGIVKYSYCGCGQLEQVQAENETWTFGYDNAGRQTGLTLLGSGNIPNRTYSQQYDATGRLTNVVDQANNAFGYRYNNQGLVTEVRNVQGLIAKAIYDEEDRPKYVSDAQQVTVEMVYDSLDRLTKRLWNDGAETNGYVTNFYGPVWSSNQKGDVAQFEYDALGKLKRMTNGGVKVAELVYSRAGDVLSLANGNGKLTKWGYDIEGRVKSRTNALAFQHIGILSLEFHVDKLSRPLL